jgi:hypothetical protein
MLHFLRYELVFCVCVWASAGVEDILMVCQKMDHYIQSPHKAHFSLLPSVFYTKPTQTRCKVMTKRSNLKV